MATIDEIPLEWCLGPGVKLDSRYLPDGHVVSPEELDAELARIGHRLSPGDIVLLNTAAGARYGFDDYLERGCGVGRPGTLHLTRQGVRVVGTDAWRWDAPFSFTRERFARGRATRPSSGKVTSPAVPSRIAKSRSWPTWNGCPPAGLR